MDSSQIDIWAQMRFVEPEALGETWGEFEQEYLKKTGFMGYKRKFRKEMADQFIEAIEPYALRIEKREVLDLKEPETIPVHVMLLGEQDKLYRQLDKESVARFNGHRIKADLEITKRIKLQQITGGFVIDDNEEVIRVGNAKVRRLKNLLKRIKPPAVIFCRFLEEMDIIKEVLPAGSFAELRGSVRDTKKDKARSKIIQAFQAGKIDWLICQQKTGGVGIDLYRASVCIFYSMSHSWIDYDQALSRLDRRGQTERVTIFLILAYDTIDDDKLEAVMSKSSLTSAILRRLKRR
jgi:SNF2 family DNA or RNA helicase